MGTLLIKNGMVITMNAAREVVQKDILIDGARIVAMGTGISSVADEVIDASGRVVMPGLIQAHTHLTQSLFRGLADDMELLDWLKKRIWPLEAAHSYESNAISARLGAAECIRGGTTSVIDMGTVQHTDAILETVRDVGLRGLFGKCMMDAPACGVDFPAALRESPEDALKESERLLHTWHNAAQGRIQYAFAPRFALSCSQGLLEKVRDSARDKQVSIHTHAAENQTESALLRQEHGMGNVEYFHKLGLTGPQLILAHCIWLDEAEVQILAETGTHVVHCPASNMKLGSGIAHVPEMLDRGINVALGCDSAACNNNLDPFIEMRHAALVHKARLLSSTAMPAMRVMEMATLHGARAMGMESSLGSLEVGKLADIAILDFERLRSSPTVERDPVALAVYEATSHNVTHTIVNGRVLLREGRHTTLDVRETLAEAERACTALLA